MDAFPLAEWLCKKYGKSSRFVSLAFLPNHYAACFAGNDIRSDFGVPTGPVYRRKSIN